MASVVSGTVARETNYVEHARDTEQRLSLLQVSWKYSVDSKGFRTWRWVPGNYGDCSEGCNLPDMRSLACASPRMLNLRIPGP